MKKPVPETLLITSGVTSETESKADNYTAKRRVEELRFFENFLFYFHNT
jgi:hypothetical protein